MVVSGPELPEWMATTLVTKSPPGTPLPDAEPGP